MRVRLAAIQHFYEMNDIDGLNWKKIYRFLGEESRQNDKRPYTKAEINKMLAVSMPRDRMIILLLASTGMRRGALPEIRLKDIEKIAKHKLYKIKVYAGTADKYTTFCTPETTELIDYWLEQRKAAKEILTPDSYRITKFFNAKDKNYFVPKARAFTVSKRSMLFTSNNLEVMLRTKMIQAGLRKPIKGRDRNTFRYSLRIAHSFRYFADTQMTQAGVHPLYVELLLGHDIGLKGAYFRPTEKDLLEGNEKMKGYKAAIEALSMDESNLLKTQLDEERIEKQTRIEKLELKLEAQAELMHKVMEAMKQKEKTGSATVDLDTADILSKIGD